MLIKIKSIMDTKVWYSEMLGRTIQVLDYGFPMCYFVDMYQTLPIFKCDVEIIKNGTEKS